MSNVYHGQERLTRAQIHRALRFLFVEEQTSKQHSRFVVCDLDTLDDWHAMTALKNMLCARPAKPLLPLDIKEAIDTALAYDLASRAQVSALDIDPILPRRLTDRVSGKHQSRPSISVWKGDITTIRDCTAIVNAANSQMLGCFIPGHKCIDNAIHASAGPGLREACYALMEEQGCLEAEGQAKVTPGYNLNSKYVIHTVGPQMSRGSVPRVEQARMLADCYRSCLQAAEELPVPESGRKVLVFCSISTGIFGFPSAEACSIAVRTVLEWFSHHCDSTITDIIFDVFSDSDLGLYCQRLLESLYDGKSPSVTSSAQEQRITKLNFIWKADYLILSAGAGLSASAGLDYTSSNLFSKHLPGFQKYGFRCLYDVFGVQSWPSEQTRWSYFMNHLILIRDWPQQELYSNLWRTISTRFAGDAGDDRYFVRTSNADGLFTRHGFPESRVSTPQGHYAQLQCIRKCTKDAIFDAAPYIAAAEPHLDPITQHLPADFAVPVCQYCNSDLVLCVRGGSYFNDHPFRQKEREYREFCERALESPAGKVVILEIGVGMSTPSVLRWHNEDLVEESEGRIKLVRVGRDAAGYLVWTEGRLGRSSIRCGTARLQKMDMNSYTAQDVGLNSHSGVFSVRDIQDFEHSQS
ncbi:A1pp-domain-containing protein [Aureobasidium pullulans]|nr:A1pp-domain-containing protein [Aureobasidium pullulans]